MRLLELLEMLRAQQIRHGDCPVVLGVEVDGAMQVSHIEMVGSVKNEFDEIAVCLATKPLELTVETPANGRIELTIVPKASGDMLTDL